MKVAIVIGTRPEIIKMMPIIRELDSRNINHFLTHSGQHYSYYLDKVFFEQFEIPDAKYNISIGSGSHAEETGKALIGIEKVLIRESPDIVLVQGDTNTTLAGALASAKLRINVGHVEAGLRSFDRDMPEELNRILVDHLSDYLFAPTEISKFNLLNEGIDPDKIFVTGNTIVDVVYQYRKKIDDNSILEDLGLYNNGYFLLTLHRQENVDYRERLSKIIDSLKTLGYIYDFPIIYPIHPRTRKRLIEFGLTLPDNIKVIDPLDYLSFLKLEAKAKLILTDSGGVQEEACILGTPCVTIRRSTERPETIEVGANILADPDNLLDKVEIMVNRDGGWKNPFGDGSASKKIVKIILDKFL